MRAAPALVIALTLIGCSAGPIVPTPIPSVVVAGGTLRVAIPAEVTAIDPWNADAASLVATRQIYEGLVTVNPTSGSFGGGLASTWQMANDGQTWTFTLRGGISFADGTPLEGASV